METLLTMSYLFSGLGLILCIVAYFAVPKILRKVFSEDSSDESGVEE